MPNVFVTRTLSALASTLFAASFLVFNKTRGGQRAIDLYYEHSAAMVGAAMSDAGIVTLGLAAMQSMEANVRAWPWTGWTPPRWTIWLPRPTGSAVRASRRCCSVAR